MMGQEEEEIDLEGGVPCLEEEDVCEEEDILVEPGSISQDHDGVGDLESAPTVHQHHPTLSTGGTLLPGNNSNGHENNLEEEIIIPGTQTETNKASQEPPSLLRVEDLQPLGASSGHHHQEDLRRSSLHSSTTRGSLHGAVPISCRSSQRTRRSSSSSFAEKDAMRVLKRLTSEEAGALFAGAGAASDELSVKADPKAKRQRSSARESFRIGRASAFTNRQDDQSGGSDAGPVDGIIRNHYETSDAPEEDDVVVNSDPDHKTSLLAAEIVDPSVLDQEHQIVDRITELEEVLRNAPVAEILPVDAAAAAEGIQDGGEVTSSLASDSKASRRRKIVYTLCALIVVAAIVAFEAIFHRGGGEGRESHSDASSHNNQSSAEGLGALSSLSTLEEVRSRGILRCGVHFGLMGFSRKNQITGEIKGFNVDLCKAVAAAVLGDPSKVELVQVAPWSRFLKLKDKDLDLISQTTTHNMGRDVLEPISMVGFDFSDPFVYTGTSFAGTPAYVDCADQLDSFNGVCRNIKVCLPIGTTQQQFLEENMPGAEAVFTTFPEDGIAKMQSGECHVLLGDLASFPRRINFADYRDEDHIGRWKVGSRVFSKEPLCLVTRQDDAEWSNIVGLVVKMLFNAEANGISQATVVSEEIPMEEGLDKDFVSMFRSIIAAVGNMGELYTRHLSQQVTRQGINSLNTNGTTGLINSHPFGDTENQRGPLGGGVIVSIVERGYLRCGVTKKRGFVEHNGVTWSGLDVEFCKALAAGLFSRGASDGIQFVEIADQSERLSALSRMEVDVLAGERVSLLKGWREPSTGTAFSFSPPYFYAQDSNDSFALATRQDDSEWEDFVYWVVTATFYAEEKGISHASSVEMPVVSLFGEGFKQMLLDVVYEVGSFGDMYNRTLQDSIPRTGRNTLNPGDGPQQFAFPFV